MQDKERFAARKRKADNPNDYRCGYAEEENRDRIIIIFTTGNNYESLHDNEVIFFCQ